MEEFEDFALPGIFALMAGVIGFIVAVVIGDSLPRRMETSKEIPVLGYQYDRQDQKSFLLLEEGQKGDPSFLTFIWWSNRGRRYTQTLNMNIPTIIVHEESRDDAVVIFSSPVSFSHFWYNLIGIYVERASFDKYEFRIPHGGVERIP